MVCVYRIKYMTIMGVTYTGTCIAARLLWVVYECQLVFIKCQLIFIDISLCVINVGCYL